jgi:hypothetical protein
MEMRRIPLPKRDARNPASAIVYRPFHERRSVDRARVAFRDA